MPDPRAEALAERVLAGVAALRAKRFDEAVTHLEAVAGDPDFRTQGDLLDLRARVTTLLAQALLGAGRPREASRAAEEAIEATEALDDREGLAAVRHLHRQIFQAVSDLHRKEQAARAAAVLAEVPVAELLEGVEAPEERSALLVKRANAEIDAGRGPAAEPMARQALTEALEAGSLREEVLARLTLARACPETAAAQLHEAWRRADAADDVTLIGAVARSADHAGVVLETLASPDDRA